MQGGRIVDVDVRLEPAPSHTIAGELGYGTGQGARVEASWTDRNFLNPEGALTLRAIAGTMSSCRASVPPFQFPAARPDAEPPGLGSTRNSPLMSRTVLLGANIERQSNFIWQKKWTWSYGGELARDRERGVFERRRSRTRGVPHRRAAAEPRL